MSELVILEDLGKLEQRTEHLENEVLELKKYAPECECDCYSKLNRLEKRIADLEEALEEQGLELY